MSMTTAPAFSIIIPAYRAAEYVGDAIQSVLNQTFSDFEIVVVNDASPDDTTEVVHRFLDPRLKYIVHEKNRGLPATRNTGIRASSGKYIAFLDHDDVFHHQKLEIHHAYLEAHSDVEITYNSRFEIGQSVDLVRRFWLSPEKVGLSDLVLGYPFSPSDMVARRECLWSIGLLDERNSFHGEDLNTNCRLALSGFQFASVGRALNYRRNHPARIREDLDGSLQNVFRNLEQIFKDPRCPEEVAELRALAHGNNYLVWSYLAFAQDETELGQRYLRHAVELNRQLLRNGARSLLDFLIQYCVDDERGSLHAEMKRVFQQLPAELKMISDRFDWALGRAYLLRGVQDIIWGRSGDGKMHFSTAKEMRAVLDKIFIQWVTHQLLGYRTEFGHEAVLEVLAALHPYLHRLTGRLLDPLAGSYHINQAFKVYRMGNHKQVPALVITGMLNDPSYMTNRGVISIFMRSLAKRSR